jgi:hypothetical protein
MEIKMFILIGHNFQLKQLQEERTRVQSTTTVSTN